MTPRRRSLRELAGETAVYGLADAVGKALSLFLFPIFTRIFTPSEYGVIEVVGTIISIVSSVLVLGMDGATTRHYYDAAYRDRQGVVLGSALMFSVLVYVGGLVPLVLAHRRLTEVFLGNSVYQGAVLLAFLGIPFTLVSGFNLQTLRRLIRPWWFAGLSVLSLSLTICLNLLLVWRLRWGVRGTYTATLIASGVTATLGLWFTRRDYRWQWDTPLIKAMVRFGLPLVPASLFLWGLSLLDRWFLVHYSTLAEVGLYSTANRLSSAVAFGVGAFQMAWGPFAFSISGNEDARLVYSRVLSYYVAFGALAVLGLSLFAPEALAVLTPASYHSAASAVPPLAIGALGYGAYTLVSIGVYLTNKTSQISVTLFFAALLNLVLCFLLIPRFGMMGAAFATALGWIAAAVFLGYAAQRAYPIPYNWARLCGILVLFLACLGLGLLPLGVAKISALRAGLKFVALGSYFVGMKLMGLVPPLPRRWGIAGRVSDA